VCLRDGTVIAIELTLTLTGVKVSGPGGLRHGIGVVGPVREVPIPVRTYAAADSSRLSGPDIFLPLGQCKDRLWDRGRDVVNGGMVITSSARKLAFPYRRRDRNACEKMVNRRTGQRKP
jgi:hypothetical protein